MLLNRFYDDALAQASYLVGCTASGTALVVDPNRDVAHYLSAASALGLRITHVTETHIHADFVSGARALARAAGAALLLSDAGDTPWKYAFATSDGARPLVDGSRFAVGEVRVDAMHTPGHTPEHLTFLLTDTATGDQPMGALTGDFIFVGDVGRPDLLERAAHVTGSIEASARQLFRSLERFAALPDHLQLWPGHGAGSACGKSLGSMPQTTLGYERLYNWAFQIGSEDAFAAAALAGLPEPPRYFSEMKRVNRDGPPCAASTAARPQRLDAARLAPLVAPGGRAVVIDTRPAAEFAAAHVPGTINIPLGRSFITWCGALVPYDRDIHLVAGGEDRGAGIDRAVRALSLIGLDRVRGWFAAEELDDWWRAARPLETVERIDAAELARRQAAGDVLVLDVRRPDEWRHGHIPGATLVPLGELAERVGELPRDRTIAVHCQGGSRAAIAASLLLAAGVRDVKNLAGGMRGWTDAGLDVEGE